MEVREERPRLRRLAKTGGSCVNGLGQVVDSSHDRACDPTDARAPEDRIALDHLELWYEHLARAAMHTLSDEDGSLDALETALHEAPPWPTPGRQATVTSRETLHGDHLGLAPAATLNQWLHGLAMRDMNRRLAGCSMWWRVTEDRVGDSVDILHGLPDGGDFAALLTGD